MVDGRLRRRAAYVDESDQGRAEELAILIDSFYTESSSGKDEIASNENKGRLSVYSRRPLFSNTAFFAAYCVAGADSFNVARPDRVRHSLIRV